ncbi:MAG: endonuclease domain-containing protein [Clostridia bacterium]|nr:endonuclease domain-containing protein [Clostridia bacterium]
MNQQWKYNKDLIPTSRTLRKNMTPAEKHLWYDFLKSHPLNFARQKVLGHYIADFYCAEAKLVIELDGKQHYTEEGLEQDAERTAFLNDHGIKVIRFTNGQIWYHFKQVCDTIDAEAQKHLKIK